MSEPGYLSAADCQFEVCSPDGRHRVTGSAAWSPSGFSAVAVCTCTWTTSASFGHLTRDEATWHARRAAG